MADWTNYWRIVTPNTRKQLYSKPTVVADDGQNLNTASFGAFSSNSWYSNFMKGASGRLQKYKQYDAMDIGDISRALDIIAEEISNADKKTGLPFLVDYQTEENQQISDTTTTTIRAALRHWSTYHDLQRKVFSISRTMVKYGDCFFRKKSDTKKWEYVDPTRVVGIEIDEDGEKVAYHIKPSTFVSSLNPTLAGKNDSIEISPASAILHFTLSDDMGDSAPFGISVLQSAYKDYQKLSMLEDSAIIYRIVRAPERRVFYLDVGNMPPQRIKQYIEGVKNDIRQKRVPNANNENQTDGTYNAECLALDTKIPLLDGRTLELQDIIKEHGEGKKNWVYSCDPVTGALFPGEISWAGVTRKNTETVTIVFDNGEKVVCTPDHMFPIQGLGFVRADQLSPEMSLVPFNRKWANKLEQSSTPIRNGYEEIYDVSNKKWIKTHSLVKKHVKLAEFEHAKKELKTVVHHVDFNKHNNSPDNLVLMGKKDHFAFHSNLTAKRFASWDTEQQIFQVSALHTGLASYNDTLSESRIQMHSLRAKKISETNLLKNKSRTVRRKSNYAPSLSQRLQTSQEMVSLLSDKIKIQPTIRRLDLINWMQNDDRFVNAFKEVNVASKTGRRGSPSWTLVNVLAEQLSARNYVDLKSKLALNNHKIKSVTKNSDLIDTGCITVGESVHKHHTFALASGVFTKNSIQEDYFFATTAGGRGSKVETLPGGATWEIPELDYFMNKVFRALRVPTSYLKNQAEGGAQYNDGKVGVAYIEELRFANYIQRLQTCVEIILDAQFKTYLNVTGINIDPALFKLKLPEPQNFALYRQAALDADLIQSFNSIEGVKYLSRRFILKRYLGLTEDDIQMNETLIKQERSIEDTETYDELQQLYDPAVYENRSAAEMPDMPVDPSMDPAMDMGVGTSPIDAVPPAPDVAPPPDAPPIA